MGDTEQKLAQFADDLNFFLKFEYHTLMELENTLMKFEGATGLKVNYDKTCLYRIGSLANSNARLFTRKPFIWSNGPIKILGIHIHHDAQIMYDMNICSILEKIEAICQL